MTVEELLDKLNDIPLDLEVRFESPESALPFPITEVRVDYNAGSPFRVVLCWSDELE